LPSGGGEDGGVKYGVCVPPFTDAAALIDLALTAERSGWDGFFLWDHLHWRRDRAMDVFDPWVLLGAVAAATQQLRIGALVTPVSRRRPWKLAKEIVTLDHLSRGRVVVGAGLGAPDEDDFAAFGEDPDRRVRAEQLDEGLDLLDRFLRGGPVSHTGRHYRVDAHLRPSAVRQPRPPIWLAAVAPHRRPLRRALRWDGVVPIGSDDGDLSPAALAEYLALEGPLPAGYDVVVGLNDRDRQVPPGEYADAGATWLLMFGEPDPGWLADIHARVAAGPP
jgi:alkanesulfonate monooxygenase SsuD/methylene tetrahydromethanopterin reductase-like flavin-dependent oxidoreductase (luciferase family)